MTRLLLMAIVALTIPAVRATAAGPAKLGVAVFTPETPFAGPGERFSFAQGVAQHLTSALGQPVEAFAYKSAADLDRDIKARKVHFGVLGALYVAGRPATRILAAARLKSAEDATWSIMSRRKVGLSELKGKVIQIPNLGALAIGFVQNGLLGGEVDVNTYFQVTRSPDVLSAAAAVGLGKADLTVAPVKTRGLVPVVGGIHVPPPVFALLDRNLPAATVEKARSAMLSYGAVVANLQGWQRADERAYSAVAGASRKRVKRMALCGMETVHVELKSLFDLRLKPEMPALEELFWLP